MLVADIIKTADELPKGELYNLEDFGISEGRIVEGSFIIRAYYSVITFCYKYNYNVLPLLQIGVAPLKCMKPDYSAHFDRCLSHLEVILPYIDEYGEVVCEIANSFWIFEDPLRKTVVILKGLVSPGIEMDLVKFLLTKNEFHAPSLKLERSTFNLSLISPVMTARFSVRSNNKHNVEKFLSRFLTPWKNEIEKLMIREKLM